MVEYAEALTKLLLTQEGIHETGFTNTGPVVDVYEGADDLPGNGYSWCASLHDWSGVELEIPLPTRSASVGFWREAYRSHGLLIPAPVRGAQGFWQIGSDSWPDHIFTVTAVLPAPSWQWIVRTIEGNTSVDGTGSQSNGGVVAQRTRVVSRGSITWGRLKGSMGTDQFTAGVNHAIASVGRVAPLPVMTRLRALVPTAKPPDEAVFWLWMRWYLGEKEFKRYGPHSVAHRPKVLPAKVPELWWKRHEVFVDARDKTHPKPKPKPKPKPQPPPVSDLQHRLSKAGVVYPVETIEESKRTGCPLPVLLAVLEQESDGGRNIVGHDRDANGHYIFPARDGVVPVTKALYLEYKKRRGPKGEGGMQGIGPMMLTWWEYQDRADSYGGCWQPRYNIRVGAEIIAEKIKRVGVHAALKEYNGSEAYAIKVGARVPYWERIVRG